MVISRRSFLGYAFAMMAFERNLRADAESPRTFIRRPPAAKPRIASVQIEAHDLDALADFYGNTLVLRAGLVQTERRHGGELRKETMNLTLAVGQSTLKFVRAGAETRPYYHFAFTIPENKFESARAWLAARTPLLRDSETGLDHIHFENINARSVYWRDPCGNIGEFIARHTLISDSSGDFTPADLLCVSEIALTPPDHDATFNLIRRELAIEPWYDSSIFLGDDDGTIIVFPPDKTWLPERKRPGELHRTTIHVHGHGQREVPFTGTGLPYVINGSD